MQPVTERQGRILRFILDFLGRKGFPPSVQEIADGTDLASTGAAYYQLKALEEKGYIAMGGTYRGITVKRLPNAGFSLPGQTNAPIVSEVRAGDPILAEENIEGGLLLDESLVHPSKDIFAVRVRGWSMKDRGIMEGSLVVARRQPRAEQGELVIAGVEGGVTLKTLRKDSQERWYLEPANEDKETYRPIYAKDPGELRIIGKVLLAINRY